MLNQKEAITLIGHYSESIRNRAETMLIAPPDVPIDAGLQKIFEWAEQINEQVKKLGTIKSL